MNTTPTRHPRRADLERTLDDFRKRNLYPIIGDDWPAVRDEIIEGALKDSSDESTQADIENLAFIRLFEREMDTRRRLCLSILERERESGEESDELNDDESSLMDIYSRLKSMMEYLSLSIDKFLIHTSPTSYRRQVRADTAKKVVALCSSRGHEDQVRCAALGERVWKVADRLNPVERAALVNFAKNEELPTFERSPAQYVALLAALFEVGEKLNDSFDLAVREESLDDSSCPPQGRLGITESRRVKRALESSPPN